MGLLQANNSLGRGQCSQCTETTSDSRRIVVAQRTGVPGDILHDAPVKPVATRTTQPSSEQSKPSRPP
eukprot:2881334-Pyramimonas_sp.AAC.1